MIPSQVGQKRSHEQMNSSMALQHLKDQMRQQSRPSELNECPLPQKVIKLVPESEILTQLQEFEYRIDQLVAEKRNRISQLFTAPKSKKRILRVFVFHAKERDRVERNKYRFTLRIQGYLYDPKEGIVMKEVPKFTSLVKKCYIELDKKLYPEFEAIEWKNHADFIDCAGFTIQRTLTVQCEQTTQADEYKGFVSEPMAPGVKIVIQLKHDPSVYHPSHALHKVLFSTSATGTDSSNECLPAQTLSEILTGIWNYVKLHGLQDSSDSSMINNNSTMKEVFGTDRISFADVLTRVKEHLILPEPVTIDYQLSLQGGEEGGRPFEKHVDIPIDIAEPTDILPDKKYHAELDALNKKIKDITSRVGVLKNKRNFLLRFADSPVPFIHELINSQTKNLLEMCRLQNQEDERKSSFYHHPQVKESVVRYLHKQNTRSNQG